jgi:hypothetical protein
MFEQWDKILQYGNGPSSLILNVSYNNTLDLSINMIFINVISSLQQQQHPNATVIIDVNDNIFKLLPFGSGRITCLGHPLGALMMEIVLAHLLHY